MVERELSEARHILDAGASEEELQLALQSLIFHQCLYEEWPHAASYKLIVKHLPNIRPIIAAFGFRLEYSPLLRMLVVRLENAVYGLTLNRLRKDETIVLLCLRLYYEEQMRSGASDEAGRVLTISSEIFDQIRRTTGEAPPPANRLFEIFNQFQRKGLVRVGTRDEEQVANVTIFPGITMLVPDLYVKLVIAWLERRATSQESGDMLQAIANPALANPEPIPSESEDDHVQA